MRNIHINVYFLILLTFLFAWTGCRSGGSSDSQPPKDEKITITTEVTVGGKVWRINPDLSYRATGIWTNPNPRPLTDAEKERLQVLPGLIQKVQVQLDELNEELGYLKRIEKPQLKVHYNFGKPPYPVLKPSDILESTINLGEFPLEIEPPLKYR